MKCGTCGLALESGEVHASTDVCLFQALKELERRKTCPCGNPATGRCEPCDLKTFGVRKAKELGLRALGRLSENLRKDE